MPVEEPPMREQPAEPSSRRVQANGHDFHLIEQGDGPAVLFCHGFPDTAETWRSQMSAVSGAGYRAVAIDMRGYGESYAPEDVDAYSAHHTVGDLVGVLDALDIQTAVLVGHDWGADVAQRAMVMRPDRFTALVSVSIPIAPRGDMSTYDQFKEQGLEETFYAFDLMKPDAEERFRPAEAAVPSVMYWLSASPPPGERWDPNDPERHMTRPSPVAVPDWADPAYVRHNVASFARTGFHGGLNYYRAAQVTFDLTPALKGAVIEQPSLYVWGGADKLCRLFHPEPPTLEEARKDAPGLTDVVCLDDVGHWVQHEARDRLNAEILNFLGGLRS